MAPAGEATTSGSPCTPHHFHTSHCWLRQRCSRKARITAGRSAASQIAPRISVIDEFGPKEFDSSKRNGCDARTVPPEKRYHCDQAAIVTADSVYEELVPREQSFPVIVFPPERVPGWRSKRMPWSHLRGQHFPFGKKRREFLQAGIFFDFPIHSRRNTKRENALSATSSACPKLSAYLALVIALACRSRRCSASTCSAVRPALCMSDAV